MRLINAFNGNCVWFLHAELHWLSWSLLLNYKATFIYNFWTSFQSYKKVLVLLLLFDSSLSLELFLDSITFVNVEWIQRSRCSTIVNSAFKLIHGSLWIALRVHVASRQMKIDWLGSVCYQQTEQFVSSYYLLSNEICSNFNSPVGFLSDFSLDRFFVWPNWLLVLKNKINR